jgi:hypothetical protein
LGEPEILGREGERAGPYMPDELAGDGVHLRRAGEAGRDHLALRRGRGRGGGPGCPCRQQRFGDILAEVVD